MIMNNNIGIGRRKGIIFVFLLVFILGSVQATSLYFSPTSKQIGVGEEVRVNITVLDVVDLYSFQFDMLYDPSVLEYVALNIGPFLSSDSVSVLDIGPTSVTSGFVDNFAATRYGVGIDYGIDGSGVLATVVFRGVGEGVSELEFLNDYLYDSNDINPQPIEHDNNTATITVSAVSTCVDSDGDNYDNCTTGDPGDDGHPEVDCNNNDPLVYPTAGEMCDGKDNDCDGYTDEGLTAPQNTNQEGVCAGSIQTCSGAGGWVDDYSGVSGYEATEVTCDSLDNDCDGSVDEGGICPTYNYYCDNDSDTYFSSIYSGGCDTFGCVPVGCRESPVGDDCDDTDPAINPNATEICDNSIDEDCNGMSGYDSYDGKPADPVCSINLEFLSLDTTVPPNTFIENTNMNVVCQLDKDVGRHLESIHAYVDSTECTSVNLGLSAYEGFLCNSGTYTGNTKNVSCVIDTTESYSTSSSLYQIIDVIQASTCVNNDGDLYDTCDPSNPSDTDGLDADCNDSEITTYPGAPEICDDGVDNNCNGLVDCSDSACSSDPVCAPVGNCVIEDMRWDDTSVEEDDMVTLIVNASAECNGFEVSFEVWEKDGLLDDILGGGDDPTFGVIPNGTISQGTVTAVWSAQWQDDGFIDMPGDPEYYFRINVNGTTYDSDDFSSLLSVSLSKREWVPVSIPLHRGKNSFSLPVFLDNYSINEIFKDISGSVDRIYTFDTWDGFKIKHFHGAPSDLDSLEVGKGYIVWMNAPAVLNLNGTKRDENLERPRIALVPGWNFIGTFSRSYQAQSILEAQGVSISELYTYNNVTQSYELVDPTDYLEGDKGYWIHVENTGNFVPITGTVIDDED